LAAAILIAPRRFAALMMVAAVCYLAFASQWDIFGLNFTRMRIALSAGIVRVMVRREYAGLRFNQVDQSVLCFLITVALIYYLGRPNHPAFAIGMIISGLGPYFFFRCQIRSAAELEEFLGRLGNLIVPLALFMVVEKVTRRNLFGKEWILERDGSVRSCAAFGNAITAGTFGATLMPLFAGLYWIGGHRRAALVGLAAATVITCTSHSSGPLVAFVAGVIALLCWRWRERMRLIRWSILIVLVALQIVMKAPVWYLMAKAGNLMGGTGWHRSEIINQAIVHFGRWWMMGTDDTAGWMPYTLAVDNTADITNQYLVAGLRGGLLSMILFIIIIVRCFVKLGSARGKIAAESRRTEILLWAAGSVVFAHVVNFFSISYFDQMEVIWYMLVAIIAGVTAEILEARPAITPGLSAEEESSGLQTWDGAEPVAAAES